MALRGLSFAASPGCQVNRFGDECSYLAERLTRPGSGYPYVSSGLTRRTMLILASMVNAR
jgi:hypothetical protein